MLMTEMKDRELEGPSDGNDFYGSPDGDNDESTEVDNTQDVDIDVTSEIADTQVADVNSIQPTGVDDRSLNQRWGERHGVNRYNLRSQREPSHTRYGRAAVHLAKLHEAEVQLNTIFVCDVRAEPLLVHNYLQMGVQAAIRKHGERAEAAVYKEIKQLDEMEALVPVHKWKGPHKPLECIVHVIEKRVEQRTLKGRACADGRGQRDCLRKEETSSPTVSVEALMLSCIIDAYKNRDVATVDVPGAFLQIAMDDLVYMTIRGDATRQLVKANPDKYGSFLKTGKRGEPYIITKLKKAVYGTL